jgi:hypothetical protein
MATMLNFLRVLAVFVTVMMPQVMLADAYLDGSSLYARCTGTADDGMMMCLGYVTGIADAMTSNNLKVNDFKICLPQRSSNFQSRDVAVKFLRDHPEWRHFPAADLVSQALKDAFPCP